MSQPSYFLPGVHDPAPKVFQNGTHRALDPTETLKRVGRLMPVMGITRIANITHLDTIGVPVVMVIRPNSRSLAVSQGKGLTLEAAKASGLMESVESYHAEHITLPLKLASYEELRYTECVVDVSGLPFHKGSVFTPTTRLLWIEGHDMLNDCRVWVPYELVHTDYTLPMPSGSGCFCPSSNGLASGNHVLEATSHAMCELIERDATSLWNLLNDEQRETTRVDLSTVDDLACCNILEKFDEAEIDVGVWDMTSDIGLPTFRCQITDRADSAFRRMYSASGMGTHSTRRIALLRALTEAAQSRLTMISGSRDDLFRNQYEISRNRDVLRDVREVVLGKGGGRDFRQLPNFEGETLADDVGHELASLQRIGIQEVIAVNLTHPLFRVPVMRVIAPGLEGSDHSPGYAAGNRAQQRKAGLL